MEILIILFLILLNGVFSMSEIALISARKNRLETAAKKGNKNAKAALDLANSPNEFLSTVQIGITLIGILTGIYSGDKITQDMQDFVATYEVLKPYSHSIAVGIVVVTLTFFSLVLGELLPKRIGLNYPEGIAKAVAYPMKIVSTVTMPFIWLLTTSTDSLLKMLQIKPTADGKVTEEEIKAIIKEGTEVGEVQEIEQDIVERVFHIGDRKVNSLMTHRSDIVYLSLEDSKEEIKAKVIDELHSVYPVCEDNLDNVIGLVLLKDLFVSFESGTFDLKSITKEPVYLIEQTSAYKALENFKTSKLHYAFVVDEHAIFQGVITLNDILEALVGDASDFDEDEYKLIANEDGTWLVDGQYSLHDFLTFFDLDELTTDYEVTTVSGFFITELGNIPTQGEKIIWNKLELEALAMDGAKIDKVLIKQYKE
ncbi:MAG: hemolysin family protein [Flavobacterium sp.]|jgi:putative hemolysin|uniref:HlyC/CorC family transporter n=1 Tax=Flavobacterium celericrescens TaxID=2709780 RepID=A0ABX0IDX4_9FLAO|nr:hemolysin family protein [Flavobacterium celericrescens]NHM04385.1 HlyC/CorC family transporter [Flavobacterium celericrescens]